MSPDEASDTKSSFVYMFNHKLMLSIIVRLTDKACHWVGERL